MIFFDELSQIGGMSGKLDHIYDHLDSWLLDGEFERVDNLLRQIDVNRQQLAILLGFLTITFTWKDELSEREGLYNRIKERISSECPGRINMLSGLE